MKRFLAAGGYFFENEMITDWFSRKEREAIS